MISKFKIKVLSLKRRKDRREYFSDFFSKIYTTPFEFFDAIDGKEYILNQKEESYFTKSNYHQWNVHVNSVKCTALSHMKMWKSCIDDNIPYLIFEDDLTEIFGGYKIKPPTDYELYLIGEENTYPNCYAYWINPNGARKLIKIVERVGFIESVDWFLSKITKNDLKIKWHGINSFGSLQSADGNTSDILLKGYDSYKKIQK
mgnify:FL=1